MNPPRLSRQTNNGTHANNITQITPEELHRIQQATAINSATTLARTSQQRKEDDRNFKNEANNFLNQLHSFKKQFGKTHRKKSHKKKKCKKSRK